MNTNNKKLPHSIEFNFASYEKETDAKTRKSLIKNVFDAYTSFSYGGNDENNYSKLPKRWQEDEKLCSFLVEQDVFNYRFLCKESKANIKVCLTLFQKAYMEDMEKLVKDVPDTIKNNIKFVKLTTKDDVINLSFLDKKWLTNKEVIDTALNRDPDQFFDILEKEHFTLDFMKKAFKAAPHSFFNADREKIDNTLMDLIEFEIEKEDSNYWIECFKNLNKEWMRGNTSADELQDDFEILDYIVGNHLTADEISNNFEDVTVSKNIESTQLSKNHETIREKIKEIIHKMQIASIDKADNGKNETKIKRRISSLTM